MKEKMSADATLRQIRRRTRWQFSAEERVRLVLKGLMMGNGSIAELCQREGINQNHYYLWRKEFLEAGGAALIGDQWEFEKVEVTALIRMKDQLKEIVSKMAANEKHLN